MPTLILDQSFPKSSMLGPFSVNSYFRTGSVFWKQSGQEDPSGTLMTASNPALGSSVFIVTPNGQPSPVIDPNGFFYATNPRSSTTLITNRSVPINPDYSIEVSLTSVSVLNTDRVGVVARCSSDGGTFYHARFNRANNMWELLKSVNGVIVTLGSVSDSFPSGSRLLKLVCQGPMIRVIVDNVTVLTGWDSEICEAGFAGLRFSIGSQSSVTGIHISGITALNV